MTDQPVILLGDANIDVILHVDRYPEVGGDARSEALSIQLGGSAANTSIALARLGIGCALLTRVGDDVWGDRILEGLQSAAVDISMITTAGPEATGLMFIPVTPAGERTIFGRRGANRMLQLSGAERAAIQAAPHLHLSGYAFYEDPQRSAAFEAIEAARNTGATISLDTAYGPALEHPQQIVRAARAAQILILGEREACSIAGVNSLDQAVDSLRQLGPAWIALKRGPRGVRLIEGATDQELAANEVPVVDTTGAGDAFTAGLLFGWCRGWAPVDAGLLAVTLGGLATTVTGAGLALPDKRAIVSALIESARSGPYRQSQRRRLADIAGRLSG